MAGTETEETSFAAQSAHLKEEQLKLVRQLNNDGVLAKAKKFIARTFLAVGDRGEVVFYADTEAEDIAKKITDDTNYSIRMTREEPGYGDVAVTARFGISFNDGIHSLTSWVGEIDTGTNGAKTTHPETIDNYTVRDTILISHSALALLGSSALPDIDATLTHIRPPGVV